jgi:hypothetical protein
MTSSPFQTRAWLRATGALDRVQTIAAGTGASIDAWIGDPTTPLGCHHFHNPRELISGAREEPFFAGGP